VALVELARYDDAAQVQPGNLNPESETCTLSPGPQS